MKSIQTEFTFHWYLSSFRNDQSICDPSRRHRCAIFVTGIRHQTVLVPHDGPDAQAPVHGRSPDRVTDGRCDGLLSQLQPQLAHHIRNDDSVRRNIAVARLIVHGRPCGRRTRTGDRCVGERGRLLAVRTGQVQRLFDSPFGVLLVNELLLGQAVSVHQGHQSFLGWWWCDSAEVVGHFWRVHFLESEDVGDEVGCWVSRGLRVDVRVPCPHWCQCGDLDGGRGRLLLVVVLVMVLEWGRGVGPAAVGLLHHVVFLHQEIELVRFVSRPHSPMKKVKWKVPFDNTLKVRQSQDDVFSNSFPVFV